MSESPADGGQWSYRPWWMKTDKQTVIKQFSIFEKLDSVKGDRSRPLPPWTEADIQKFADEDPVHGRQVYLMR